MRNYDVCGQTKIWREQKAALLKPLQILDRLWQELSTDFVTALPPCDDAFGQKCSNIMVITDLLSKAPVYKFVESMDAKEVAARMIHGVFLHHLLP